MVYIFSVLLSLPSSGMHYSTENLPVPYILIAISQRRVPQDDRAEIRTGPYLRQAGALANNKLRHTLMS